MKKPSLLYLCHRIPFPPNKGDKIRSFNILKHLSQHYDVHLGCFIDDKFDWQYAGELEQYCATVKCVALDKKKATIRSSIALFKNLPLSVSYYSDAEMHHWVNQTVGRYKPEQAFIFCSSMAQYLDHPQFAGLHKVIDFVDIDSDKWRQYADKKSGIMKIVYQRESRTLAAYEKAITERFDASVFVSQHEADMYRSTLKNTQRDKVVAIPNGVNESYFSSDANYESLQEPRTTDVVFTGAMDYWANVDAVTWFVTQVWPKIRKVKQDVNFYIVGGSPTKQVLSLQQHDGVFVTGRVADVRPYLDNATLAVTPLKIARGIQNKVLEAMAMSVPVVTTTEALEGINTDSPDVILADSPQEFADATLSILNAPEKSSYNRQWIDQHFKWEKSLSPLLELLNGCNTDES